MVAFDDQIELKPDLDADWGSELRLEVKVHLVVGNVALTYTLNLIPIPAKVK